MTLQKTEENGWLGGVEFMKFNKNFTMEKTFHRPFTLLWKRSKEYKDESTNINKLLVKWIERKAFFHN